MSRDSFDAKGTLEVGSRQYEVYRLDALQQRFDVARLPFSLKVLLENLLRMEGNGSVGAAASQRASASMSVATTEPSPSVRRRFSSSSFSENGSRATSKRCWRASRR